MTEGGYAERFESRDQIKNRWKRCAQRRAHLAPGEGFRISTDAHAARAPWPRRVLSGQADFLRLCHAGLIIYIVRWLEMLAIAIFVYQRTHSPFLVTMMTLLRLLPMGLFGAQIGALAERMERRSALIAVVAAMMACSASLALLALSGHLPIWPLAIASLTGGIGWATDNPVRRVMLGEVAGSKRLGMAMSLDVALSNVSRMIGPVLGGAIFATLGMSGVFLLSVVLYATALVAMLSLRARNADTLPAAATRRGHLREGFALVRRDRRLVGILLITVLYNLFGWPFTSLVPVIGAGTLHLDPRAVGLLAGMDGLGAFLGALVLAAVLRPRHYARIYVGGLIGYLTMVIAFALLHHPVPAGLALLAEGFLGAGYSVMQATLIYQAAPPGMRARLLGMLSVAIGMAPIGLLHIGLLASVFGAPTAVLISAIEGLAALALTWPLWRTVMTVPTGGATP